MANTLLGSWPAASSPNIANINFARNALDILVHAADPAHRRIRNGWEPSNAVVLYQGSEGRLTKATSRLCRHYSNAKSVFPSYSDGSVSYALEKRGGLKFG